MKDAAVLVAAVLMGFLMLWFDQRTDDTGVEAALLVALSLVLAVAAPRRALAVALAGGLPIAAWSVVNGNTEGSLRWCSRSPAPDRLADATGAGRRALT